MTAVTLRSALTRYAYNAALFARAAELGEETGVVLDVQTRPGVLRNSMLEMVREQSFDICEMSPTSYLMARLAGAPLTAVPVFPYRQFPLYQVVVRDDSAVREPGDLAGARIGSRTWAQPTALWLREILGSFYEVDLSGVTWTFTAEDPFPGVPRPGGSVERPGETLDGLLLSGAVDAVMGLAEVPDGCRRLLPDWLGDARAWYAKTGLIPANHVVVADARLAEGDTLDRVVRLFDLAKSAYLASGDDSDSVIAPLRTVTGRADPLPNGWAANADTWRVLVEATRRQGMISDPPAPETLIEPIELTEPKEEARG
jgi:4,5-dihydroxyphthalate decarboxylase